MDVADLVDDPETEDFQIGSTPETDRLLETSCIMTLDVVDFDGFPSVDEFCCRLQGVDSARFGPRCLKIDGVIASWFRPWLASKNLVADDATFFMPGAFIERGRLRLPSKLPNSDRNLRVADVVQTFNVPSSGGGRGRSLRDNYGRSLAVEGMRETLAVRVVGADRSTTDTEAQINTKLYAAAPALNFRNQFDDISFGDLTFFPTPVNMTLGIVTEGVFTVNITDTIENTPLDTIVASIESQLNTDFQPQWADLFDHYLFIIPNGTTLGGDTREGSSPFSWTGMFLDSLVNVACSAAMIVLTLFLLFGRAWSAPGETISLQRCKIRPCNNRDA